MSELSQKQARMIIESVASNGTPPEYGIEFFTAGLDDYLSVMKEDYLESYIADGGSAFKLVVGVYGGGKTHFLYNVRNLAWRHNYVVSYVSLSQTESPFHQLNAVYAAIARGLTHPLSADELLNGYSKGIQSFLRREYNLRYEDYIVRGLPDHDVSNKILRDIDAQDLESISFGKAIVAAFRALSRNQEEAFQTICQWLSGEAYQSSIHKQYGILEKIDKTTAFKMIRSLATWIHHLKYNGLVILLDEAERVPSLSTKQRDQHLSNLREVIDACGQTNFQRVLMLYAVPDENFLDGATQAYEALNQRLATVFEVMNPYGVKIKLDDMESDDERIRFLEEVGRRLADVFTVANNCEFEEASLKKTILAAAEFANTQRFADSGYKRLFVQKLIRGLQYLRRMKEAPTVADFQGW